MDPIGAIAGLIGANQTNAANKDIAREATAFNAKEARTNRIFQAKEANKNRTWQERLSNSSHQREVKDLIKAGLNPILSATGGASTPGGASGSGAQASAETADMEDPIAAAMSSGLQMKRLESEIKLMDKQGNKADADAENTKAATKEQKEQNKMWEMLGSGIDKAEKSATSTAKSFRDLFNPDKWGSSAKQTTKPPPQKQPPHRRSRKHGIPLKYNQKPISVEIKK